MPFARQCAVAPHVAKCPEAPTDHWSDVEHLQRSRPPGGGRPAVWWPLCFLVFACVPYVFVDMLWSVDIRCYFCRKLIVFLWEGWRTMQPAWVSLRLLSHLIHEAIFHLDATVCETILMFSCCDMICSVPCFCQV